jgi:hypothetical protein
LIKLFQKFAQVEGAQPSSLVATSETSPTLFDFAQRNMFFFAAPCSKRTEKVCSHIIPTADEKTGVTLR